MSTVVGIVMLAIASQLPPPDSANVGPSSKPELGQEEITIDFIAAEQLRHAAEIAKFDFIARESGESETDDPGEKVRLENVYRVTRGKDSTLLTTESWSRIDPTSRTNKQPKPGHGVTRLLITPRYVIRWYNVLLPHAKTIWAEDWKSIGPDSAKNEFEAAKRYLELIDPQRLCFGMEAENPLWGLLQEEQKLSSEIRPTWKCSFTDSRLRSVHASRFGKDRSQPDLTFEIALTNGGVISRGEFRPYSRTGTGIRRITENAYVNIDGVFLLSWHLVENYDSNGKRLDKKRIDFSDYVRSDLEIPLSIDSLEMPDGTKLLRRLQEGKQLEYVWQGRRLIDAQTGESVDLSAIN